ncbi:hypothetical protein ABIB26_001481 [Arthrobacter sp. UYEF20]
MGGTSGSSNVFDEYTRTPLAHIPCRSFKASDVVAVRERIIAETGCHTGLRPQRQRARVHR